MPAVTQFLDFFLPDGFVSVGHSSVEDRPFHMWHKTFKVKVPPGEVRPLCLQFKFKDLDHQPRVGLHSIDMSSLLHIKLSTHTSVLTFVFFLPPVAHQKFTKKTGVDNWTLLFLNCSQTLKQQRVT